MANWTLIWAISTALPLLPGILALFAFHLLRRITALSARQTHLRRRRRALHPPVHNSDDGWRTLEAWKKATTKEKPSLGHFPSQHSADPPPAEDRRMDKSVDNFGCLQSMANLRMPFTRGQAAVLVCLFRDEDERIRVLLTKRAQSLSSHSGEVALPGGKRDDEDEDDIATALREAKEEIGLDPSLVKIVTTVEPFISKKLLRVTPVIGLLSDKSKFTPVPNPEEVDAVFNVPLDMFLKEKQHRLEQRKWLGYVFPIHYFDYEADQQKFVIWGLTAAILMKCASIIYEQPPRLNELQQTIGLLSPKL